MSISHLYTHTCTHSNPHTATESGSAEVSSFLPVFQGLFTCFPAVLIFQLSARTQKVHPAGADERHFIYSCPFFFIHIGLNCDKALLNDLALTSKNVRDVIIVMISPSCMIGNVSAANWVRSKRRKGITPLVANESDAGRKRD